MASSEYLCFAGHELINTCRTTAYAANGVGPGRGIVSNCGCSDSAAMQAFLGETYAYSVPGDPDNPAPWYDAAFPASQEFGGIIPQAIVGLDGSGFERAIAPFVGNGSFLGRGRRRHREILVQGMLVASTCRGIEYGWEWLKKTLRECNCSGACRGEDLKFLKCFPGCTDGTCDESRVLKNVALMSGPDVTQKLNTGPCGEMKCSGQTCQLIWKVEFTLAAGDPFAYHKKQTFGGSFTPCVPDQTCDNITWVVAGDQSDCGEAPCASPVFEPPVAPIPFAGCVDCTPFQVTFDSHSLTGDTGSCDAAVSFGVFSGDSPLRSVNVRFFNTLDPLVLADASKSCGGFAIPYLAAGSSLKLDGTTQRVEFKCSDEAAKDGSAMVAGLDGAAFAYPTVSCDIRAAVVSVDCSSVTGQTIIRKNFAVNPSAEVDISWFNQSGYGTLIRTTVAGEFVAATGTQPSVAGFKFVSGAIGIFTSNYVYDVFSPGDFAIFSFAYMTQGTLSNSPAFTMAFIGSSGNYLGTLPVINAPVTQAAFTRLSVSGAVPAGATGFSLVMQYAGPASDTFFFDQILITNGIDGYFDGATADTGMYEYDWEGSVDSSYSRELTKAPALPDSGYVLQLTARDC